MEYNELLRRIEPEKIICYNEPFSEMQGDIVFVDYDLSSWRYMNDDPYVSSKYVSYITGERPLPSNSKLIIFILSASSKRACATELKL